MKFTKMHGAGNDYIYIDARGLERDWPGLAVAMSDRHLGVGSDGIILLLTSDKAHLRMRMFNADGSEGEMCGNGIRCFVRYALDKGIVPSVTSPVSVETLAGVLQVTPIWDGNKMVRASVAMGEPRLRAADIPVLAPGHEEVIDYPLKVNGHKFNISCVSMGNPHAVAFVDEAVDDIPLQEIGPRVRKPPDVSSASQFRDRQRDRLDTPEGARLGARFRSDHGLRKRGQRHSCGRAST